MFQKPFLLFSSRADDCHSFTGIRVKRWICSQSLCYSFCVFSSHSLVSSLFTSLYSILFSCVVLLCNFFELCCASCLLFSLSDLSSLSVFRIERHRVSSVRRRRRRGTLFSLFTPPSFLLFLSQRAAFILSPCNCVTIQIRCVTFCVLLFLQPILSHTYTKSVSV